MLNIYFSDLAAIWQQVVIKDKNGVRKSFLDLCAAELYQSGKIIAVGNGGSAAIAAHTANDFLRNCHLPAVALSETAVLTCLGNDLGYSQVYSEQIKLLLKQEDLLIAISSSGKSPNILQAVKTAKDKGAMVLTFSGFDRNNPLSELGDLNVYVPSGEYGFVELVHQIILHGITDYLRKELL